MFSVGKGPARGVASVLPGLAGGVLGPCDACGIREGAGRTRKIVDREWLLLCDDAAACAKRYRRGVSPGTFAAGLRGELLAVAP